MERNWESHTTEQKRKYAGFWIRFVAYLLDSFIIGIPATILIFVVLFYMVGSTVGFEALSNPAFLDSTYVEAEISDQEAVSLLLAYLLSIDPETEVIVTTGASEAIDIAFRTILNDGVEVILPGPVYPGYEPIVRLCGAKPVYVDIRPTQFRFTADVIEPYITDKTRCIVLPYPSNPTGVSLTKKELEEIAELIRGRNIFIMADEIYSELNFEQEHYSIGSIIREQTIVINGLSKSHSMTGWRIGLLFAPKEMTQHILKVHQYNVTCATTISQAAALEALTNGLDDALPMKQEYQKRRDFVFSRLESMGLEVVKPDGAFYFFVKIPPLTEELNSFEFCLQLVEKVKLAVVPGSAFSEFGEGYFRLSYAYSMETLAEGLKRLETYLSTRELLA